ncbi:helix-turn-helix transcriptional regulator [Clostridium sp. D33t1_170424_F3]|uniref:helix-turn-helix domain-containing protein n=1 Tax=Clostridium sp. D33t1_170424_F3 TaxID=2787099 RepID=UPI0018A9D1C7|nr:helix-turn-helix transcriptional regulator [Clostridium sp. D33t1_170424_F3]
MSMENCKSEVTRIVGERLRNYREQAGLSQEELAEKADIHPGYVGMIERADRNPTVETVEKIARALDLPLETLFENIVIGNDGKKVAAECYQLIQSQPLKEQEKLYDILKQIVDYKKF